MDLFISPSPSPSLHDIDNLKSASRLSVCDFVLVLQWKCAHAGRGCKDWTGNIRRDFGYKEQCVVIFGCTTTLRDA